MESWEDDPFFIAAISSSRSPIRTRQPFLLQKEYSNSFTIFSENANRKFLVKRVSNGTITFAAATAISPSGSLKIDISAIGVFSFRKINCWISHLSISPGLPVTHRTFQSPLLPARYISPGSRIDSSGLPKDKPEASCETTGRIFVNKKNYKLEII